MWALGSMRLNKKQMKRKRIWIKTKKLSKNRGYIKSILEHSEKMKTRKFKIDKVYGFFDGSVQKLDTCYITTLTIEEARECGLIKS